MFSRCLDMKLFPIPKVAKMKQLEAADKRVKELEEAQRWIPCAEGK
jgi:hypothetical protein